MVRSRRIFAKIWHITSANVYSTLPLSRRNGIKNCSKVETSYNCCHLKHVRLGNVSKCACNRGVLDLEDAHDRPTRWFDACRVVGSLILNLSKTGAISAAAPLWEWKIMLQNEKQKGLLREWFWIGEFVPVMVHIEGALENYPILLCPVGQGGE